MFKDTILTSKKINQLTDFQYRVWSHLILYVDDYGRGSADAELIKCFAFPRRKRISEADIEKALADLAGMGCILLYEVDGESYFCFPNWSKHQRIQQKKSRFPEPNENMVLQSSTVTHGKSPYVTVTHRESPSEIEIETETEVEVETEVETKKDAFASFAGDNAELLAALNDFRKMRKSQRCQMTPKAETLLLSALEKLSRDPVTQIAILNQSVMNGWKSVYPLKDHTTGTHKNAIQSGDSSLDLDDYEQRVQGYVPVYRKETT